MDCHHQDPSVSSTLTNKQTNKKLLLSFWVDFQVHLVSACCRLGQDRACNVSEVPFGRSSKTNSIFNGKRSLKNEKKKNISV